MYQDRISDKAKARAPVGEVDLRLYLGSNAAPYVHYWERARASSRPLVWSWNWWGFLFPVPWLFYRKLWAIGAALILLPILLDAVFGYGSKGGMVLAALIGAGGIPLVIERAERKVRTVEALGLVSQQAIERLRRSGGVSRPGAVLGALLMVSLLGLHLYGKLPAQLPGCEAARVRATVLDIARDNEHYTGLPAELVALGEIRTGGPASSGKGRLCYADLTAGDERLPVEFEVFWEARSQGRYVVDLRIRDE